MQIIKITSLRNINIDIIRILAMLGVVFIHTVLNFTVRTDFFATKIWFLFEPLAAISKPGVLLFFILSGYLVINKNRSIFENWQKIKKRILIPLLFFGIINLIYEFRKFNFDGSNTLVFWQNQLVRLTNFPSSPLWFLVVLFFIYLLNPLWQTIFEKSKRPEIALYLFKIALIFSLFITIIKFPSFKKDFFFNNFTAWIGFTCLYLYGGLVRNNWIKTNNKFLNLGLIITGLFMIMIGDYYTVYTNLHNQYFLWSGYFFEYLSVPIILLAIGLFNYLINIDFKWLSNYMINSILFMAKISFGVYLIHSYVVSFLIDNMGFVFDQLNINVYLYNFLNFTLVLGISMILSFVINKTPKLKMIVGN